MPFIKCPECGKVCSVKLKNCPKCEAPLDAARAAYYNAQATQAPAHEPAQQSVWGQAAPQPQNNPWGQPQTTPRPQDNPWTQQQSANPWGQPQATPRPQDNPWTQQQPQANPWGRPQTTPRPQDNPWTQQQPTQANPWGQPTQGAPAQQQASHCTACGAALQAGARFCPSCGAAVTTPSHGPAGIPTRKNPYSL